MLQPLNTIRNLDDPLKQYMVEFDIKESPVISLVESVGKGINSLAGTMDALSTLNFKNISNPLKNFKDANSIAKVSDLKFRASSFSYPGTKIKQTSLNINGFNRKIGTIQNKSGVWKCKVDENCGASHGSIIQLIQNWCDCIHSSEFGLRFPSIMYATTCVVSICSPTGAKIRSIYLRGFYPIEYSVGEINPSSSEPVSINVSFNYDFFSYSRYVI